MEFAKSILGIRSNEGYSRTSKHVETLSEDDEEEEYREVAGVPHGKFSSSSQSSGPGAPFSAIISSLCPQDIISKLENLPEDELGQADYRYDEFGFKVEIEDGPEQCSSKLLSQPFVEDPSHRLKWAAYIEFTHNNQVSQLTWEKVDLTLPHSKKLGDMVEAGIPHSLRSHIWPRLCGALEKKNNSALSYQDTVKNSNSDNLMTSKQIEKDLLRTLPTNACFASLSSTGIGRLRRILRGLAWLYTDIGYCQGTGTIVASLLLFMEEEDTFWMMCTIIEDLLPASYYSSTLLGVQADQRVLGQLIATAMPQVDKALQRADIEICLITLHWFLTAFANVVHPRILLRIWDLFFYEGSIVLFRFTLGLLKMKEDEICSLDTSCQLFTLLSDIPFHADDIDELLKASSSASKSVNLAMIIAQRQKHLAYLMAEHGAIVNPELTNNLPKQTLNKRMMKPSRSVLTSLLWGGNEEETDKAKNVHQTELLVDLRDAVLRIGRHFQSIDPANNSVSIVADYSMESHSQDLHNYISVASQRRQRAKALVDFERHDADELGFRKNDIITVLSTQDEHCWVGELGGERGWFPARFVEILDERSKSYSCAGDDTVSEDITNLVRGVLCPALKALFEHGLKKPILPGGATHPWMFIEEAATKDIEKNFHAIYSRLVLCKTFRLDEEGKVLTPEEILYRSVQAINKTHDAAHAQMDIKFRSLVCCGLNEQVLHLWLESLCSAVESVESWYHSWSFLRSPGWVQIKCDLRVLSEFSYKLGVGPESPDCVTDTATQILGSELQDMLLQDHLFSWELGNR